MKKTAKLIAIIIIAIMICLNLATCVNATDDGQLIYVYPYTNSCLTYKDLPKADYNVWNVDYTNHTITMSVEMWVYVGKGSISTYDGISRISVGNEEQLENYTITSSNESVLKVTTNTRSNGNVVTELQGLKEGTAKLTFTSTNEADEQATFNVTILPSSVEKGDDEITADDIFGPTENQYSSNGTVDVETFNTILKVAKENNLETFEIVDNINNGLIIWTFNTADTNEISKDFISSVNVSNEKLSNIESDDITDGMFVDFDYSGNLPSTTTVTISTWGDAKKFGDGEKTLNLYYYNPETKSYEFSQKASYSDGSITFKLDHCSTYALTETALAENTSEATSSKANGKLDEDPKTGLNSIFAIELITALSFVGVVIAKKYLK